MREELSPLHDMHTHRAGPVPDIPPHCLVHHHPGGGQAASTHTPPEAHGSIRVGGRKQSSVGCVAGTLVRSQEIVARSCHRPKPGSLVTLKYWEVNTAVVSHGFLCHLVHILEILGLMFCFLNKIIEHISLLSSVRVDRILDRQKRRLERKLEWQSSALY